MTEALIRKIAHYCCFPSFRFDFWAMNGEVIGLIIDEEGNVLARSTARTTEEACDGAYEEFARAYFDALGDKQPNYCGAIRILEATKTAVSKRWWKAKEYTVLCSVGEEVISACTGNTNQNAYFAALTVAALNIMRAVDPNLSVEQFNDLVTAHSANIAAEIDKEKAALDLASEPKAEAVAQEPEPTAEV